jgi:hypothetical protein
MKNKLLGRLKAKWTRVKVELKAPDPKPLDNKKLRMELQGLQFGLRCMMALGGYRVKPKDMSDDQVRERADATTTLCANLQLMIRCAEDVILRHGLRDEYQHQLDLVGEGLNNLNKAETQLAEQVIAKYAKEKAVSDVNVQGIVGEGKRPVAETGLRIDRQAGAGVRRRFQGSEEADTAHYG